MQKLFSISLLFLSLVTFLPGQQLDMALTLGGNSTFRTGAIETDAIGNVYLTGSFYGTADFDPGAGTSNLTSSGSTDIFVAKYSSTGALIWAKRIGGGSGEIGIELGFDPSGNLIVFGSFNGPTDFDPGVGTENKTPKCNSDLFLLKLSPSGGYMDVITIGSNSSLAGVQANGRDMDIEGGNIWITGTLLGTSFDFDPGPGTTNVNGGTSTNHTFLAKYSTSFGLDWAFSLTTTTVGHNNGYGVAADASGNSYLVGDFVYNFRPNPNNSNYILNGNGSTKNPYIAKYNSNGLFQWARSGSSTYTATANAVALDNNDNPIMGGYITYHTTFGSTTVVATPGGDPFLASYTKLGVLNFAHNITGTSSGEVIDIAGDAQGNFLVVGKFKGTADFDFSTSNSNTSATNSVTDDGFVLKISNNGAFNWVVIPDGVGRSTAENVKVGGNGKVYVTGDCDGDTDFDPTSGVDLHTDLGSGYEGYGWVLNACSDVTTSASASICSNDSIFLGGSWQNTSGTYMDTYTAANGCDSTVNTTLSVLQTTTGSITDIFCKGSVYNFQGQMLSASGTYTATVISSNGCDSLISLQLTEYIVDTNVTNSNGSLTASNFQSIQWYNCGTGQNVPGATSSPFTPATSGSYAAILTDQGCTDTSNCHTILVVGTQLRKEVLQLSAYPNPTGQSSWIRLNAQAADVQLILSDMRGKTIQQAKFRQVSKMEVSMAGLAQGMYFLQVVADGRKGVIKLRKE